MRSSKNTHILLTPLIVNKNLQAENILFVYTAIA